MASGTTASDERPPQPAGAPRYASSTPSGSRVMTEVMPLHASATKSVSPPGSTSTLPSRSTSTPNRAGPETAAADTKSWRRSIERRDPGRCGTGTMKSRNASGNASWRSQAPPRVRGHARERRDQRDALAVGSRRREPSTSSEPGGAGPRSRGDPAERRGGATRRLAQRHPERNEGHEKAWDWYSTRDQTSAMRRAPARTRRAAPQCPLVRGPARAATRGRRSPCVSGFRCGPSRIRPLAAALSIGWRAAHRLAVDDAGARIECAAR